MVKMIGGFEDLGEAAHEAGQVVVSQTKKQAQSAASTTVSQITGSALSQKSTAPGTQGTNEQGSVAQTQQMSDDQAKQFLKDLYGPSTPQDRNQGLTPNNNNSNPTQPTQQTDQGIVSQTLGFPQEDPNKGKTPQEIAKMQSLRNQLHADYYSDLTRPKQQEERVAEKLEREDQEKKMEELAKEEEKPQSVVPPGTKQGTAESVVGVSG